MFFTDDCHSTTCVDFKVHFHAIYLHFLRDRSHFRLDLGYTIYCVYIQGVLRLVTFLLSNEISPSTFLSSLSFECSLLAPHSSLFCLACPFYVSTFSTFTAELVQKLTFLAHVVLCICNTMSFCRPFFSTEYTLCTAVAPLSDFTFCPVSSINNPCKSLTFLFADSIAWQTVSAFSNVNSTLLISAVSAFGRLLLHIQVCPAAFVEV